MRFKLSLAVIKDIRKIKTDKKLTARTEKQLALFKTNPTHPSLRLHKLSGEHQNTWSISISKSIRMIYTLLDDEQGEFAYFADIGTHDEVYKK